jgi:hypothetical protein
LTLEVGSGRRTVVIVTVGDVRQVPYWGCTIVQWPVKENCLFGTSCWAHMI